MALAEGSARRLQVVRPLSESFAVSGNRKHNLAVRNWAKFRGVFSAFWLQTLFSRPTFVTIRPTFVTIEHFGEMAGRMTEVGIVFCSPIVKACGAAPRSSSWSREGPMANLSWQSGKPFWQSTAEPEAAPHPGGLGAP